MKFKSGNYRNFDQKPSVQWRELEGATADYGRAFELLLEYINEIDPNRPVPSASPEHQ